MSSNRKQLEYIFSTGTEEIDCIRDTLTKFIQTYQKSLDIGKVHIQTEPNRLIVTLSVFTGDEYLFSNTLLQVNPVYSFFTAIKDTQYLLDTKNNEISRNIHIQHFYTSFAFSVTANNAARLEKAIQQQLTQTTPTLDKKYFLAKLKYQVTQDKWRDKAITIGNDNKTPSTILKLQHILRNPELEDDQKFNEIAELMNPSDSVFSFPYTIFRDNEVQTFYDAIQQQISAIKKAEAALASSNTVEMDAIYPDIATPSITYK